MHKQNETRAKDVLPNINRTQAAVIVYCRHPVTPGCDARYRLLVSSEYTALSVGMTQHFFVFFVTGDYDL